MKNRAASLSAFVVIVAMASFVPAVQASAVPAYCSASQSGNGATAYCYTSASGSQFRAVAGCSYTTPSGSTDHTNAYGPWETQGDPVHSLAQCSSPYGVYSANAQTR